MTFTTDARTAVRLRPLTFLPEGDGVVVGCVEADSYAVLPPDGAALLERLSRMPLADASRWYEDTYGEPVDLEDFLGTIEELGFLGGDRPDHAVPQPERLRWQRLGELLFSPTSAFVAAAVVAAAVACVFRDPSLLPHTDHVFFSDYLLVIELTVAFGQIPLILIHEVFHVLAARRLGVAARIRLSHRMYFVVFETVMDGLVVVPRSRRYLPMLAGMLADLLLVCGLTLVAAAASSPTGPASPIAGVCLALAFTTLVRFALEFLLFLRTDIYYLICTLTGTIDLHTTSSEIVANRWWRLLGRTDRIRDPARWHTNDVRAARWYTPVHVLGYALAVVLLLAVLLPISWRFLVTAGEQLLHPDPTSVLFWDALALLLLNFAQPAFAGWLWLRERTRRTRRPGRHRAPRKPAAAARRQPVQPVRNS
jgi:hypothetical protein